MQDIGSLGRLVIIVSFLFHRRTPLHAAAFSDHVECVSLLLSHGAHANAVDTHLCRTPLMMAALNGQTNTVGQYTGRSRCRE